MPLLLTTDYHMHSHHSPDAHPAPAEICRQALAKGLTEIAITDHMEWEPAGQATQPDFSAYFADLEACRAEFGPQGLTVFSGVELGNPHEHRAEAEALLARFPFDVVIASVHWLDGRNIHLPSCFDGEEADAVYARYFASMAQMAATFDGHLIAHFDRIFWPGTRRFGLPNMRRLEGPVRAALESMVAHGRVLEINTTFWSYEPNWLESVHTVLTWYHAAGGRHVAVNSDAHHAHQVGRHRAEAAAMLETTGFTTTWRCTSAVHAGA